MRTIPSDLLRFQEEESPVATAIVSVILKAKDMPIGHISWAPAWKQYAFFPGSGPAFTYRVMGDITTQLVSMMDEWARAAGRKATHGKSSPYRPRQKRCGNIRALASGHSGLTVAACGRWAGHTGPHRQMGSDATWEA